MSDVVNAFVQSPNYQRGALFVIYDEWGGFFDHVRPPRVPDDHESRDLQEDFGQMGFRIPAVAVSPFARGRASSSTDRFRVDHGTYGHESILKLIAYRFGLGNLTKRMAYARNIGRSFNWKRPDFEPPELPSPPEIVTQPCALGGQDVVDSQMAHQSDLAALEELAERHGVPAFDGSIDQIFTLPKSVLAGIQRSS